MFEEYIEFNKEKDEITFNRNEIAKIFYKVKEGNFTIIKEYNGQTFKIQIGYSKETNGYIPLWIIVDIVDNENEEWSFARRSFSTDLPEINSQIPYRSHLYGINNFIEEAQKERKRQIQKMMM